MKCTKCQSPMKLASSSRGFQTYCCVRGCSDSYQFTYDDKPQSQEVSNAKTQGAAHLLAVQQTLNV